MTKQISRIEFIDLAKGIAMIIIIMGHLHIDTLNLYVVAMPLFFILSGWFFKQGDSLTTLLKKKVSALLIPFAFFYIISYILFYACQLLVPGLIKTPATGIFDVFTQRLYFNGPLWFLLCLFWVNIIAGLLFFIIKQQWLRTIVIIGLGLAGMVLGINNIYLPCTFDIALTALPLFYCGTFVRNTRLFSKTDCGIKDILLTVLFAMIAIAVYVLCDNPHIGFATNNICGNVLLIYIEALFGAAAILLLCKQVNHLPLVNYFGKYSLIPLCLHHLIYRPIMIGCRMTNIDIINNPYFVTFITILICWGFIPLCIKYIPWFVGQKQLIK